MITRCKWSLMPIHTVHVWKQSVAPPYKLEHVTWCDLTLCADSSNIFIRAPTWRGASRLTSLVVTHFYKRRTSYVIKYRDYQTLNSQTHYDQGWWVRRQRDLSHACQFCGNETEHPQQPCHWWQAERCCNTHISEFTFQKTYHKLLENSDAGLQKHRTFHNIDIKLKRPLTRGLCFQTVFTAEFTWYVH